MALKIYEVVANCTRETADGDPNENDWSVWVAASDPTAARDLVRAETTLGDCWVIYEWGLDLRAAGTPAILRGPLRTYPAYNRGWKQFCRRNNDTSPDGPIVEWDQR